MRESIERTKKRLEIEALRALTKNTNRSHFSQHQQEHRQQVKLSERQLSRSLSTVAVLAGVSLMVGVAVNELCAAGDYTEQELSTGEKAVLAEAADNKVSVQGSEQMRQLSVRCGSRSARSARILT